MRVFELAKELGLKSKELVSILNNIGIDVSSHMSGISDDDVKKVKEHLKKDKKPKPKTKTTKKTKTKPKKKEKVAKKPPEKKKKVKKEPDTKKAKKKVKKKPEKKEKKIPEKDLKKLIINGHLTIYEFARKINVSSDDVIKKMRELGVGVEDYTKILTYDEMVAVGSEYGFDIQLPEDEESIVRTPVIAFLGHVDHGKTSLLDAIRKTNMAKRESGGITQHIGVSEIVYNNKGLSFIDTPGHQAFTAMRARGAQVTDIVVLVIAADDGVMPQTVEALNHAKAAGVAIIIAINKMDKPGANPDVIKRELAKHNIIPDIDGGETLFVEVSATEGAGIDELLETIILQAELMDLKGYPARRLMGVVIESQLDKRRGPVATIMIKEGVLKTGDEFMVGSTSGKVRAMNDSFGERVDRAEPGKAVEILGLEGVPDAGDILLVADKNVVNELTTFTREKNRIEDISTPRISLDDWFTQLQDGGQKDLNVIVKGDVYGTSEVINDVIESIHTETININIIHSGVGNITENDILLAEASNAIVIGFGVDIEKKANELKTKTGIDVNTYDIIYDLIEDIEKAIEGMLEPEIKEVLIGKVEVRKIFTVSSMGVVAGSFVKEGKVVRGAKAKLMREEEEVYSGKIDTLRRFESDVKEVKKGYECGITLQNFNDIQEGDMIFVYQHTKVKREFKIENE